MDKAKRLSPGMQAMMDEARARRKLAQKMHQVDRKSLKEIGDHFGVTRERARQMVAKANEE